MSDSSPPSPPLDPPAAPGPAPLPNSGKIEPINVADEIKSSFLDYSMSVIISRALPDVRDGLKPSQRRILYAMQELNLQPNRSTVKCAKIVGETMGNYHPHGDMAIYPTLVHMAQPWAIRERLVEGQGNFGSVEGDPPAAMRYTEARLTHLGAVLMQDLGKNTVDFAPTYDEKSREPVVLPAAFPNLLVNGGTGIAVGMATNLPPHNLGEVVDAICAQIDNPHISIDELLQHIKGPDFPTGCSILGTAAIREYFTTGRASLRVRSKVHTEESRDKQGREIIVVDEIPYGVNRALLVKRIAELVNEKVIPDITAIRDESDENTRVVIEIKRDAVISVVINNLFKHTQLETTFAVNMLAIDQRRPKTLTLKELINCYIEHRRDVVLRRTRFELESAEKRAEQLEAFLIALANLDEFIRIIRESKNREEAKTKLLAYHFSRAQAESFGIVIRSQARLIEGRYEFSEAQVDAILELRLYQLTGLEIDKVKEEYNALLATIADLADILAREERVLTIIKSELNEIKAKHATPRRTEIHFDPGEIAIEDLIANEGVVITLSHQGAIKRTSIADFRAQRRGGRGVIGVKTREGEGEEDPGDFVEFMFSASTHDYLMFFTNSGRLYVERVHEIPEGTRTSAGRNIANVLELQPGEKVVAFLRVAFRRSDDGEDITWKDTGQFVLFATQNGTVKKTALDDYRNFRKGGIIAIGIEEGDVLIKVALTHGDNDVILVTRNGMSIRFHERDARPMGRPATGVRGISLESGDRVVALAVTEAQSAAPASDSDAAPPDPVPAPDTALDGDASADPPVAPAGVPTLLVAGENGIGKRTPFSEYRVQSRGGKGIITMKTSDRTGLVVGAVPVTESDEIMLITTRGQLVRIKCGDIRLAGRNTMGVKLIDLDDNDRLLDFAPVISHDSDPSDDPIPDTAASSEDTPAPDVTPPDAAPPEAAPSAAPPPA